MTTWMNLTTIHKGSIFYDIIQVKFSENKKSLTCNVRHSDYPWGSGDCHLKRPILEFLILVLDHFCAGYMDVLILWKFIWLPTYDWDFFFVLLTIYIKNYWTSIKHMHSKLVKVIEYWRKQWILPVCKEMWHYKLMILWKES